MLSVRGVSAMAGLRLPGLLPQPAELAATLLCATIRPRPRALCRCASSDSPQILDCPAEPAVLQGA